MECHVAYLIWVDGNGVDPSPRLNILAMVTEYKAISEIPGTGDIKGEDKILISKLESGGKYSSKSVSVSDLKEGICHDLTAFVTTDDLTDFVTKDDLEESLEGIVRTDDLTSIGIDLDGYAKTNDLGSLALSSIGETPKSVLNDSDEFLLSGTSNVEKVSLSTMKTVLGLDGSKESSFGDYVELDLSKNSTFYSQSLLTNKNTSDKIYWSDTITIPSTMDKAYVDVYVWLLKQLSTTGTSFNTLANGIISYGLQALPPSGGVWRDIFLSPFIGNSGFNYHNDNTSTYHLVGSSSFNKSLIVGGGWLLRGIVYMDHMGINYNPTMGTIGVNIHEA